MGDTSSQCLKMVEKFEIKHNSLMTKAISRLEVSSIFQALSVIRKWEDSVYAIQD